MIAVAVVSTACYLRLERSPYARYLVQVFQEIDSAALDPPPTDKLFDGAVGGMVDLLDRHSAYINEQDTPSFEAELDQEFGGVGVVVSMEGEPPRLTVVGQPLFGTPAYQAGIQAGDDILAIDGQPTAGLEMLDVLRKMRGARGDAIRLTIRHAGQTEEQTLELVRQVINIPSVLGDVRKSDGQWDFHIAGHPKVGYIRITSFGKKTVGELEAAIEDISGAGVDGLILDLRDNPGGLLDAAIDICDMFLPAGLTIVSVESRTYRDTTTSTGGEVLAGVPMVILIDGGSASASEIVAACLQDHKRAVVAGDRSFGKGTVQEVIHIESGRSTLKLTTARYLRPSGKNIHRADDATDADVWGVTPNEELRVVLTKEQTEAWAKARRDRDYPAAGETSGDSRYEWDPQLRRVIEYLRMWPKTSVAAGG